MAKKKIIGDKTVYTKERLKASIKDCRAKLTGYKNLLKYLESVKPID